MTTDKAQALAGMSTRQKAIAGVLVVVALVIIWQLSSIFGGGGSAPKATPTAAKTVCGMQSAGSGGAPAQQMTPKPAALAQTQPLTDREIALMRLQQETQEKYVQALGELQMLRVARDIAQTNKDISTAKLATVVSQKKIVDILAPPIQVAKIDAKQQQAMNAMTATQAISQEVKYNVISVSQLQYRWSAVLGSQGSLYNVHVGDVLPLDGSTVVSIQKDGVDLQKDGVKKHISLVPII